MHLHNLNEAVGVSFKTGTETSKRLNMIKICGN